MFFKTFAIFFSYPTPVVLKAYMKFVRTNTILDVKFAGFIVLYLKLYCKDCCSRGRIKSIKDFNHLARKARRVSRSDD